jgi:hypothetical protein
MTNQNERVQTIVTERTVIEVTQLGRGCTGKIVDSTSPLFGQEVFGDRWFVIAELDSRAKAEQGVAL